MVLKAPQNKFFFGPILEKNLLKNRLSIRLRNFAPLNEPPKFFLNKFLF